MLVSIVMVTFKQSKYIREAIDSILNQTYKDIELIIVPVYGDKETLDIIDTYKDSRVKIVMSNFAGLTHQRNLGCFAATGKYSMFFDSDDIMYKDSIERLVKFAEKHNAVIVYSNYCFVDKQLKPTRHIKTNKGKKINIIDFSLVKRKEYLQYLPFKKGRMRVARVWSKMLKKSKYKDRIVHYPFETFLYRQHNKNVHNKGSQNDFICVSVGSNPNLSHMQKDIKIIEYNTILADNYYTIYAVNPKIVLMYIDHYIFKRIVIHWDGNEIWDEVIEKYVNYKHIHHVMTDQRIYNKLKNFNIENVILFNSDSEIKNYIIEEK